MPETIEGIGVSPGSVIGPAHVLVAPSVADVPVRQPDEERQALEAAVAKGVADLQATAASLRAGGMEEQAGIFDAQALMLGDPSLLDMIRDAIDAGKPALAAIAEAEAHFTALFEGLDDPYMAARAADVRDVAGRLQRTLYGLTESPAPDRPSILVAHDLQPSETATLDRSLVLGLVTELGSTTSHTAILARALGIPAVVGTGSIGSRIVTGQEIALDGERGTVILHPGPAETAEIQRQASVRSERESHLRTLRDLPAQTRDGYRVTLAANIGSPEDIPAAIEAGAEGVGLFRTEFLFAAADHLPTEEEQVTAYRSVLEAMPHHTVVVRTLDIGADKPLPYLPQPAEANPFLGLRGIRYALANRDILRTQMRALMRAAPWGKLAIMVPMVSDLEQIEVARRLLEDARRDLDGDAEMGIMMEVPAAALIADTLARHVAFMSVGTNDLTQYALAVDRGNERVASLYQPLHPGVLRLMSGIVDGAHRHDRWAGVCGEMAGDTRAIPLLLGLGYDELSMTSSRIPAAREVIRSLDHARCRDLAARALSCETANEVERLVRESQAHS